jgi:nitronate monooxygenase
MDETRLAVHSPAHKEMCMWPDRRLLDLFGIDHPIVQAPMATSSGVDLAVAVAGAGGLGSLPAGTIGAETLRGHIAAFRERAPGKPVNVNFFTHRPPRLDNAREAAWREALKPYCVEFGIDPNTPVTGANRAPFNAELCAAVEDLRPEVVSFHYGLPDRELLARVKAAGCKVMCSATTVAEARHLAGGGCDAIIAQGNEAGGHRGMFLTEEVAEQLGTFALVPQVANAVPLPVIAAGGVGDARGIVAALALGAAGVQIGTGYLHCPEANLSEPHRARLRDAQEYPTVVTNVMTGRPARGFINRPMRELGPISEIAPEFPLAAAALVPLARAAQNGEFSNLWAGQAAALGEALPARELTLKLAAEAQTLLRGMAG